MSDQSKENNKIFERIISMATPENIQKYIFGFKKSGSPRALHDIIEDYRVPAKKKKSRKDINNSYAFYSDYRKGKKKKKKKKTKKHWHI